MRWSFIIFFPLVIHSSAKPVARVDAALLLGASKTVVGKGDLQ